MAETDWRRVRAVFEGALDRPVGPLRARFLDDACADDTGLRGHVAGLLAHHDESKGFLEPPVTEQTDTDFLSLPTREGGTRVGGYVLERVIGAGGVGTIYQALQEAPRRRVALKMLTGGLLSSSAARRFSEEAEILARLHHPGIAQIHEAGVHVEGRGSWQREIPWFAMELVAGGLPITEHARERELDLRAKLELFIQVCDAVQHGHLHGVIHRDLKPGNVLVDRDGRAKIIDFGLARVTDGDMAVATRSSASSGISGTIAYMSPEQLSGDARDLDTRTDVYSLGVLLYELLCDRLPLDVRRRSLSEAASIVREQVPPRPAEIDRALAGDVDWIAMHALEKQRERRYRSAQELADDVRRFLDRRAILARPASAAYRARVFARRHRAAVGATAVALLALLGTLSWSLREAGRAREALARSSVDLEVSEETRALLEGALTMAHPLRAGPETRLSEVLSRLALELEDGSLERSPLAVASLFAVIGDANRAIGREELAAGQLARAVAGFSEQRGAEHGDTLHARNSLGHALADAGRAEEAEAELRPLIELLERVAGVGAPETCCARNALAAALRQQARLQAARALLERNLAVLDPEGWRADDAADETRAQLAHIFREEGDHAASAELLREVIARREALGGARDSAAAALTRTRLADDLLALGAPSQAVAELRLALPVLEAALGRLDGETLLARRSLARAHAALGNTVTAIECQRDVQTGLRAAFGPSDPDAVGAAVELGELLLVSDPQGALPVLVEALACSEPLRGAESGVRARAFLALARARLVTSGRDSAYSLAEQGVAFLAAELGPTHAETLGARIDRALLLHRAGRSEVAMSLLQETIDAAVSTHAGSAGPVLRARHSRAGILSELGRADEAAALLEQALADARRDLGPEAEQTLLLEIDLGFVRALANGDTAELELALARARAALGAESKVAAEAVARLDQLASRSGNGARRAQIRAEQLAALRAALAAGDARIGQAELELGRCLREQGRLEEAEELLRAARADARAAPEPAPLAALLDAELGAVHSELGDFDAALPLLEGAHGDLRAALGPGDPRVRAVVERLAELHSLWGDPAEAARYRQLLRDSP